MMRLSFALAAWATVAVAAAAPKRADSGLAVELRRIGTRLLVVKMAVERCRLLTYWAGTRADHGPAD